MSDFDEPEDGSDAGVGLEPGKVYFMREVDLRTGESFPYYKIGKVLDAKDVAKRLKEHQTGNPRVIETVTEIESPMVTRLETMLHNIFGNERIHSGEWFAFGDDAALQGAIAKAVALNDDLKANESAVATAQELGLRLSTGAKKTASSTDEDLVDLLLSYKTAAKTVLDLSNKVRVHLSTLTEDPLFGRIGKFSQPKPSPRFGSAAFKKAEPEIYESFQTKEYLSSVFTLPRGVEGSAIVLSPEMLGLAGHFEAVAKLSAEDAHLEYLRLWGLAADLHWQIANLTAHAKVATEDFDGIEGLTGWKRYINFKFDSARFKTEMPDLHAQYVTVSTPKESFKVFEWKSY